MSTERYKGCSFIREPEGKRITDSKAVWDEIKLLIGDKISEKECFCSITLDGSSRIIKSEIIHMGTLNQSLVHPREVFRPAVIDNAAGIIIAHNHPSGTLEASRADIQITDRLKEAGKIMGIDIIDHVIVTELGYYSFSDEGLL
jgi:DNA repair protein RadC